MNTLAVPLLSRRRPVPVPDLSRFSETGSVVPFAVRRARLMAMAAHHQTYRTILQEVARGSERSALFWFLVERHDELLKQAAGKRLRWDALCRRFTFPSYPGLADIVQPAMETRPIQEFL